MEAVWTLLIVSNPLFWILSLAIFGFIIWAVEWERGIVATLLFAGFCTLLYFFGNGKDVVAWSLENPYVLLWRVAEYVACGVVWATVYWIIKCYNRKHEYQDMLAQWLEWHHLDPNLKKTTRRRHEGVVGIFSRARHRQVSLVRLYRWLWQRKNIYTTH